MAIERNCKKRCNAGCSAVKDAAILPCTRKVWPSPLPIGDDADMTALRGKTGAPWELRMLENVGSMGFSSRFGHRYLRKGSRASKTCHQQSMNIQSPTPLSCLADAASGTCPQSQSGCEIGNCLPQLLITLLDHLLAAGILRLSMQVHPRHVPQRMANVPCFLQYMIQ